ncbi:NERD domain-containing protein [Sutcliffiella cohnii]|uniref:NERD domain-containing protein n=1 Tax=Sutcliffiella TaxID=2837511 RepID=UPI000831B578|nr:MULTISPECIES: NERD domain-containing protein [Sutcliffiella]WBL14635.1 NERD domain-containing protein [Sutcliffiella sp. NC1]
MKRWIFLILVLLILSPLVAFLIPLITPLLLIAAIIIFKVKFPEIKGAIGESRVNRILNELGPEYKVYHDLYVPNEKGGTSQLDHVVTSPYGVFVIETKNYEGWIIGKEHNKYWMQVIFKRKERFYNPIWQNYGHVQALKKYLHMENGEVIHSIIAFSRNATLKLENIKSARVIHFHQLKQVVKEMPVHKINEVELKRIDRYLDRLAVNDKKSKKQLKQLHVKSIQHNVKKKNQQEKANLQQNSCPKCGSQLVMRKGKYGTFYGCSSFPKCKYTKQMENKKVL